MTIETTQRSIATMRRTTAFTGLAAFALLAIGQGLIQVGGAEPPFDAPANDIVPFFVARDAELFFVGTYLSVLCVITMLWFLGGLYAILKEDWRAPIALVSGVVFVGLIAFGGWELAVFRASEGLDPQVARLMFDMGNMAFATAWVALGSFAVATGWAVLATRLLPPWLGWWSVVTGGCLVVARAVWTTPFWLLGFSSFWVWVVAFSVLTLRSAHPRSGTST
jgi:hypothetical protein